jgi:predicted N-acetyltransferase YhbS
MNIIIRPETVRDYNAISSLTYTSFINWRPRDFVDEPILIDNLRHNEQFNPELSLVAELEGEIIGHVLLSPFTFYMQGVAKKGLWLAPLCVDPRFQRSGIGGLLMVEAHRVAAQKGFVMSLLCGHDTYYPKFGYLNKLFALNGAKITVESPFLTEQLITERAILRKDLPWVTSRWLEVHSKDALANYPGDSLAQWYSHSATMKSSVFHLGDKLIGYVKYRAVKGLEIRDFLPAPGYGELLLEFLVNKLTPCQEVTVTFAMEADVVAALLPSRDRYVIQTGKRVSPAFLLKVLDDNDEELRTYCQAVLANSEKAGVLCFPSPMDIDN